ncbi:Uncharacterised protein [Clostridioides difficile]|nr:Uncharacterised protein [Clostridioides difficile]
MPPWPQRPGRCLLGPAPNPEPRANMARSVCVALLLILIPSTLLFLLSAPLIVAQQSVNIRLDGDDLLHIPARLLVLSIEALFLCRQLAAFLLQHIHFRELRPAQQTAHFRLCRPVQFNICLMLRKEFPAVLCRLVLLKDRACFGILNRCSFQPGIGFHGLFCLLDLLGKRMETVGCFFGFLRQLPVLGQAVVLYIGEGGGHLFEVEHLRPPLIARPLTGGQLCLNIHRQTDFPLRASGAFFFAFNGSQYILQIVAVPQRGGPQAGKAFLPLSSQTEADTAAPHSFDFISGPLHQGKKFFQIGGALGQRGINGKAQPVLIGKRPFPVLLPLPIVPVFPLAPGFRVLHDRQAVFKTQPVREPPEGEAGAPKISEFPGAVKGGGIVIDVTVDVLFVCMGGNDKSVPSLCPAHCQLIADTVRLLRGDLARIEGLPYLITQHVICLFLFPARHGGITGLCQKKLVRHGGRVALISGDILSAFCFLRVFTIVQTIPDGLGNGFAFARMALQQSCGSQKSSLPSKRKGGPFRTAPASGQHGPRLLNLIRTDRAPIRLRPAPTGSRTPQLAVRREKGGRQETGIQSRRWASA